MLLLDLETLRELSELESSVVGGAEKVQLSTAATLPSLSTAKPASCPECLLTVSKKPGDSQGVVQLALIGVAINTQMLTSNITQKTQITSEIQLR